MSYLAIIERVNQSWNAYDSDLAGCVVDARQLNCAHVREVVVLHARRTYLEDMQERIMRPAVLQ